MSWRPARYDAASALWPRDGDPSRHRFDVRAVGAIAFLLSAALLLFLSLPVPGYLLPGRGTLFAVMGTVCGLLAALIAWAGYVSGPRAAGIIFAGDLAILVAALSLADREDTRVLTVLFTLPTMFIAVFMPMPWLVVQGTVTVGITVAVFAHAGVDAPTLTLHTLVVIVCAVCPAVIVLVLRTQLDRAVAQSNLLATTDPLTGLANRRGLHERYPALLARSRREGRPIGVIVADVDHFKQINDVHGHAVGDEVLRLVADTVARCVRGDDLAVRLGGEEIAVVAVLEEGELTALAERLRSEVERAGTPWGVTVSLGLARRAEIGADPDQRLLWHLVDEADDRMYAAKRAGRNRVGASA